MWSNPFTRIDHVILTWLTSFAARSTSFPNVMTYLPSEQTSGALVMAIYGWYWFRQGDPATKQGTREHLLCPMFAAAIDARRLRPTTALLNSQLAHAQCLEI
jgi:hypothetical protein